MVRLNNMRTYVLCVKILKNGGETDWKKKR